jgi:hypothetical protein
MMTLLLSHIGGSIQMEILQPPFFFKWAHSLKLFIRSIERLENEGWKEWELYSKTLQIIWEGKSPPTKKRVKS